MYRPYEFDYLVQATAALDFLHNSTARGGEDFEKAAIVVKNALILSAYNPYWCQLLVETHERKTSKGNFEALMQKAMDNSPDDLRYQIACFLAWQAITQGHFDKMSSYYPHLLVEDRPLASANETAEIVTAAEYDNTTHAEGARALCFFALMDDCQIAKRGGLRVLDIGCGTGLNSEFVVRYTSHLTGLDLSLSALRETSRAKRYDVLLEGDARETIGHVDGPMDLIIATGAVYFFRDLDWLFSHAARLLSPTGQLVFNAFPAGDDRDVRVTRSGNYRHCHSTSYLERTSREHGLELTQQLFTICHGLPTWFLRFKLSAGQPDSPR